MKLALYLYTPKAIINKKQTNKQTNLPFQNGGQYTNLNFTKIVAWPEMEKPRS